jgi:hypothetical protein
MTTPRKTAEALRAGEHSSAGLASGARVALELCLAVKAL